MISYSIFIVDDDPFILNLLKEALSSDYKIAGFSSAEAAFNTLKHTQPDLILLDIGLPGMDGIKALNKIKQLYPEILAVMLTADEDIQTVISTMKSGAHDYIVKPVHIKTLEKTIHNAFETIRLKKEVLALQEKQLEDHLPCFIEESKAIRDVMEFIKMVAKSPDTPILILGETGTGKELIAHAIHYRSPNYKGPFIAVNCASLPREIVESELFGYEKGAFTGASTSGKKGLIEEAAGGTLFLDEVGDLDLETQAKLLRFLEEGEFYKVGCTRKISIKTRVVSATNRNVDKMVEEGRFRKDLYFRLGVIKVHIPSLNERKEDIIPLAKYFLYKFGKKFNKSFIGISPEALQAMMTYRWTGNIREFRNIIERGVLIGSGPELTALDLGFENADRCDIAPQGINGMQISPLPAGGIDLPGILMSIEKYYIQQAYNMTSGNESKAAGLLKMNHHTFRYRRRKLFAD